MAATSPRWIGAYRYFLLAYKRTWRGSLTTSFLYPVLYLAAIGLGLGKLVRDHGQVDGVSYVAFLAPGLLAATAMQIGTNEATFPVMAGIKWLKTYVAMLATPLEVGDVVTAVLAWIVTRVAIASGLFLVIMAAFGLVRSWWGVLASCAAVLTGAAFAAPVAAFSATRETDKAFVVLYRFGVIPLFLFSGTFFPVSTLPGWLQAIARWTPLYHGVSLCRGFVLGRIDVGSALLSTAYLGALALAGVIAAHLSFRRRLVR